MTHQKGEWRFSKISLKPLDASLRWHDKNVSTAVFRVMECLKKADLVAIEATKKALYARDNERRDLNEQWRQAYRKQDPAVQGLTKKIEEKCRIQRREQAEFNSVMERLKNHDPIALMSALMTLEEKCCDPAEAERRKALRAAKAEARRKARHEALILWFM